MHTIENKFQIKFTKISNKQKLQKKKLNEYEYFLTYN